MIRFRRIEHDVKLLLPNLRKYFASRGGVAAAYLFGSCATDMQLPLSDVDIGVLLHPEISRASYFDLRLEIMKDIVGILGTDEIDLLILNDLPAVFAYHVIEPRLVIFEGHPEIRVRFETSIIDRYLDAAPLRRLQFAYLKRQIQEGSFFGQP